MHDTFLETSNDIDNGLRSAGMAFGVDLTATGKCNEQSAASNRALRSEQTFHTTLCF